MERKNFVKLMALAGLSTNQFQLFGQQGPTKFKHLYAPHFGMFEQTAGKDFAAQLQFMAANGFMALEDNGLLQRSPADQKLIADTLKKLNMTMGVFVVDGGDNWKVSLTTGKSQFLEKFIETCKKSVTLAKEVNAKWVTVVPGFYDRSKSIGLQTANVVEALRHGADIFEPHGIAMVLEPLSDTPELFLRYSDQTYEICKAVDSPSCKILYDIYHMQRNEGNLIANIDAYWSEIAYIQIGDNPGRKEPGTGEINYQNLFKHIYNKGYRGVMGMEHGNAIKGKEGEQKLIEAYKLADSF
jgi:hydroxypyruvate isomerase